MMRPGSEPMYVRRWPADFGLVAHPAQAEADELAPERLRNRLAQARLARAGRPDEAEDGALHLVLRQLAHRDVFEDALLDAGQPVVVALQHLRRGLDVQVVLGCAVPGKVEQPVQVVADNGRLGRGRAAWRRACPAPFRPWYGPLRAAGRPKSSPATRRARAVPRPPRRARSGWPASARAGSTRAGSCRLPAAPGSGCGPPARGRPVPAPG